MIKTIVLSLTLLISAMGLMASDTSSLRLIPFPKEVTPLTGSFPLDQSLVLSAPADTIEIIGQLLSSELRTANLPVATLHPLGKGERWMSLSIKSGIKPDPFKFRDKAGAEDYAIDISQDKIVCFGFGEQGLIHAAQTLCQLIRANREENGLPCLSIRDWPSLQWRGFMNDMTRGPSAKISTLKGEVDLSSYFKMNLYSYYMEYAYAFSKHPTIGPVDGSLQPEELKELVAYAARSKIEILGSQQSFGHMDHLFRNEKYKHLGEYFDKNSRVLMSFSPAIEESYKLIDELYSDQVPLLPFGMFNVCCDETFGIGTVSAGDLVVKYGVDGVYVGHMNRLHDLIKNKYGKRMMMWGDIILHHPDKISDLPKDTVMLTWAYDPRENFEGQIIPFSKAGFDFFVCPGVNSWGRILPDFNLAMTNIRNFVRDGVKHGAMGMLNTDWKDDGESLNATNWYGAAWGAECAWNGSTTKPEDFNRRISSVLFGEKENHFSQAIELLAKTFKLSGMDGMKSSRFWENDFKPRQLKEPMQQSAESLLKIVQPALEHLERSKKEARANADLLDLHIFQAQRMEFIGLRMLDSIEVSETYQQAFEGSPRDSLPLLKKIHELVQKNRDVYERMKKQYIVLWNREVKPFPLEKIANRYQQIIKQHDKLLSDIEDATKKAVEGKELPSPRSIGLGWDGLSRSSSADEKNQEPLAPSTPWVDSTASHRLGLVVQALDFERSELPIELDLTLSEELKSKPVRAFCEIKGKKLEEIPVQLDPIENSTKMHLTFFIPGTIPAQSQASVQLYLGLTSIPKKLENAVFTTDAQQEMKWLENDKIRVLLGTEGAHLYRWEVKSMEDRDLTAPGEKDWAGFADLGETRRNDKNELKCLASGPAMVRYRCTDPSGRVKQITLFAGTSWVEIITNDSTELRHYGDTKNFASDSPTPGQYLFSDGTKGSVGTFKDKSGAQVRVSNVFWCVQFNQKNLALGLVSPESPASHQVAPGLNSGGVWVTGRGIDHTITFGGLLESEPDATMKRLQQTLNFKAQPRISLYTIEQKK